VGLGGYGGLCLRNTTRRNLDRLGDVRAWGVAGNEIGGVLGDMLLGMIAFVDNGKWYRGCGRIVEDNTNTPNLK
jgi:hypothetical protein